MTKPQLIDSAFNAAATSSNVNADELDWTAIETITVSNDRLAIEVVANIVAELGLTTESVNKYSVAECVQHLKIRPAYRKLVSRWITELRELEYFPTGDRPRRPPEPPTGDARVPEMVRICMDIVLGRRHILEFIFGTARPAWFNAYTPEAYDADPVSIYLHEITKSVVATRLAATDANTTLRILEVGAGMGGLTAQILPLLDGERSYEYVFTDISKALLHQGSQRFSAMGNIQYLAYDINKCPRDCGIAGRFDLVLAYDVLHCAKNLQATVTHLGELLEEDGWLVNEQLIENRASHMLIPGLMPGFTDFEDDRIDSFKTLLPEVKWFEKLNGAGLSRARVFPEEATRKKILGHGVIIAGRS